MVDAFGGAFGIPSGVNICLRSPSAFDVWFDEAVAAQTTWGPWSGWGRRNRFASKAPIRARFRFACYGVPIGVINQYT